VPKSPKTRPEPKSLLLEIGCEELPAGFIQPALEQLKTLARDGLAGARIPAAAIQALGTPRRLALLVEGLADRQEAQTRELTGPAVRVAFDADGNPTNAARGFAKSAGIPVESLERITTPKGEYLLARVHDAGKPTQEILPGLLPAWVTGIQFPKTMHWNGSGRFARPVRWLLALWDGDVVSFECFGIQAGRRSRGHRTLSPDWFEIKSADRYVATLREHGVLASPEERSEQVQSLVKQAAATKGGKAIQDRELVEEVANLIEWPDAILGNFDERYLELPAPIVITAMRAHQRYFAVEKDGGTLLPHFVAIRNGRGEGKDSIRRGNEAVLRARLEDARFYWENDRKAGLENKVQELKKIVWHEKLGSVYDRTQRIVQLAEELARELAPKSRDVVSRAAYLSKADLASEMIRSGKEFAGLEGVAGAEYAAAQGEPPAVVRAIREHILPRSPSDPLPSSIEGSILALADRLDVIVGGFRAGLTVTGSQDPYGLRRAGNGIVRILLEKGLRLDVQALATWLGGLYDRAGIAARSGEADFAEFWSQRVASALEEKGIPYDTAAAVLAVRPGDPLDVLARAKAIEAIRRTEDFEGLMIGYRRATNILKSAPPGEVTASGQPLAERPEAFSDKAEADLHLETKMARQAVETYLQSPEPDYQALLRHLLGLKPSIDRFFEAVMVMAEDPTARKRRLAILEGVRQTFIRIAEFSALPTAPGQKTV
jgi:glycyl-tRNA synthetase beta chain